LNITPLLDLAFVLLVIFIITTTPVVNDMEIDLPSAAKRPKDPKPKINYVTVESSGRLFLGREEIDLASLQERMSLLRSDDPDLSVVIRGSGRTKYKNVVDVMDQLQQANVLKVNLATEPIADGAARKE
jgi:biopolymer transport protein ExbD